MKIYFIINPAAGGGKARKFSSLLQKKIKENKLSADCLFSRHPEETLSIARRVRETGDLLVACGGDGTIHSMLPALVNHPVALGVIPWGTANDLARSWKIPRNLDEALRVLVRGKPKTVDVIGTRSGIYIAGAGGIGFDTAVISRVAPWKKHWRGFTPYFPALILEFFRYPFPRISVKAKDWEYHGSCWQVLFTKIRRYAFLMNITGDVRGDDGLMKICIVPPIPKSRILVRSPLLAVLGLKSLPQAVFFTATEVAIASSPSWQVHGDGELIGHTPQVFQVLPKALTVMMPS